MKKHIFKSLLCLSVILGMGASAHATYSTKVSYTSNLANMMHTTDDSLVYVKANGLGNDYDQKLNNKISQQSIYLMDDVC